MASQDTGVLAYHTLGADINKRPKDKDTENKEGVTSEKLPELTLDLSDEQIVKLTEKWESEWKNSNAKNTWEKSIEENERYWLGKQFSIPNAVQSSNRPMVDNLIFESLETYLPQVTRRNPEPLVYLNSEEDTENQVFNDLTERIKDKLTDLADINKLRLKLKKVSRFWAIYHLGVAKFGWDLDRDIPTLKIIRPQKLILDPKATIDEDGYTGNRIGEYREMVASDLMELIDEDKKSIINDLVKGDEGTTIQFIEWWTPQYTCWKLGKNVLRKIKNPHWNYDRMVSDTTVDDFGMEAEIEVEKQGINHLPVPMMPYVFLSVFNLGDQPVDNTSLIQQNLSNQDLINKRNRQITDNADDMNGGMVISLERSGLTQSQARNVTKAVKRGGAVVIPSGSPRDAVDRMPPPGLPADIYNQLADTRSRLRDIFGTKGSSQAGLQEEKLATGKIMSRTLDTDRIGGGVSEYLEQFADDIYNWFVQLLYVYDKDFQFIAGAVPPKLIVSVKEGSLLPKDSIAIANQALQLAGMGRISNVDLFKRLDYPNPEEMAANVWLETNAPQLLFGDNPLVQQAMMMQQQAAQAAAQQEFAQEQAKQTAQVQGELGEQAAQVAGDITEQALT